MEKSRIKDILREGLMSRIKETQPQPQAAPKKDEKSKDEGKEYEESYAEIQRKLTNSMLKASQVFAAAGLGAPDDATARSLNSKKLRRDTNSEGGRYQFSAEELSAITKVVNNPASYLNTKK
jgi:hypothetical protein